MKKTFLIICFWTVLKVSGQEPMVTVKQGLIIGVQIYPESYPGPIHAYMGIPYASAPVGLKRFAPPEKHPGWNKTLIAANIAPNCPHNTTSKDQQSEDCLFLNIWTPIISDRYKKVPVIVFFDGVDFAHVNPLHPIPGQDLAAEGLVVVTANYRLNVFGFLCLGNGESRGNMGLLDQYMVLLWIQENIEKFGGDRRSVTLMGYSSGGASVLYHLTSPRTKDLFSQAIIMSPRIPEAPNNYVKVVNESLMVAEKVGCRIDDLHEVFRCLQNISTQDLLTSFHEIYQQNSFGLTIHPIVESFLPSQEQYLSSDLQNAFRDAKFWNIPILIGSNNLEVFKDDWMDLMNKGFNDLYQVVSSEMQALIKLRIGNIRPDVDMLNFVTDFIRWKYLRSRSSKDKADLLGEVQKLYSQVAFDAPIFQIIQLMSSATQPVYVYRFSYSSAMDLTQKPINFSGSIHGNDLPFLFGPTLFQQITRRRGRQTEKTLMQQMKTLWTNFIKMGNPLPGRSYDIWRPFNEQQFIQNIGDTASPTLLSNKNFDSKSYLHDLEFWYDFLPKALNFPRKTDNPINNFRNTDPSRIYKHATYTLTGLVVALLVLLFICIVIMKQRARERQRHSEF